MATVFLVRRYARPELSKSDEPALNVRGAQYIGRKVDVERRSSNGRGKVRVGDTIWAAEGEDAAKGAEVEVTGVNGTVLVVVQYRIGTSDLRVRKTGPTQARRPARNRSWTWMMPTGFPFRPRTAR